MSEQEVAPSEANAQTVAPLNRAARRRAAKCAQVHYEVRGGFWQRTGCPGRPHPNTATFMALDAIRAPEPAEVPTAFVGNPPVGLEAPPSDETAPLPATPPTDPAPQGGDPHGA